MRWSIIRLIWLRELRDQLRDRRTILTIVALPLLLYPLASLLVLQFAMTLLNNQTKVAVVVPDPDIKTFPLQQSESPRKSAIPVVGLMANWATPANPALPQVLGAISLVETSHYVNDFLPLLVDGELHPLFSRSRGQGSKLFSGKIQMQFVFMDRESAENALFNGEVDLLLSEGKSVPPFTKRDFLSQVANGKTTKIVVEAREGDDQSRRANDQLSIIIERWKTHLLNVRLQRNHLPNEFLEPIQIVNVFDKPPEQLAAESLLDILVRTFPFMLVMWSLAGALHPAVDLCAGEKERGTMETLLISPAGRIEIVLGKFLTIWVFSAGTATMHLVSMSIATWQLRQQLPQGAFTIPALLWCMVLIIPLAALFSAICLAVGAYARSSKEGQYYLMPLFWVTMPLVFLTMAPGIELNPFYSMVPVTGVALLMQNLMLAPSLESVPWFYFFPVLATVVLYSSLALRWAVVQFQSEEVLFREAERLDLRLLLSKFFTEKGPQPTPGLAFLCFAILFVLRWLQADLSLGEQMPLLVRTTIILLGLVAAPPLFMMLLMTTKPRQSINLRWCSPNYLVTAVLILPLAELIHYLLNQFPRFYQLLSDRRSFVENAHEAFNLGMPTMSWIYFYLGLALLPAVCKELAFRGFILNGLRSRMSDSTAIMLSSFLFALYHMNVFALVPFFLLGLVAGVLTVRSGSILPAILLHTGCNVFIINGPLVWGTETGTNWLSAPFVLPILVPMTIGCLAIAGYLLWITPRKDTDDFR